MSSMPFDAARSSGASDAARFAHSRVGQVLRGKYRLDRVLGVGGMGAVYAATHRNRKQFAIKMLHPELSRVEEIATRFLREGYVANSVEHPGAVTVLDDDVAEDGSAFLVMELLEGKSFEALWEERGRSLPPETLLALFDQVLEVLAAAHTRGVVHRDLKPANLFLTREGRVKVLDFGVARLRDAATTAATHTGATLGTPAFMAPEQALGNSAEVDAQTDIYAVGATLFVLITGRLVHEGTNPQQLLVSAATRTAPALRTVEPRVSGAVASVVDRALAFEKGARWANAAQMRDALATASAATFGRDLRGHSLATAASFAETTFQRRESAFAESALPRAAQPAFDAAPLVSGSAFTGMPSAKTDAVVTPVVHGTGAHVEGTAVPGSSSPFVKYALGGAALGLAATVVILSARSRSQPVESTRPAASTPALAPSGALVAASASALVPVAPPSSASAAPLVRASSAPVVPHAAASATPAARSLRPASHPSSTAHSPSVPTALSALTALRTPGASSAAPPPHLWCVMALARQSRGEALPPSEQALARQCQK